MKPQIWNLIATSLCLVFSLDYSNALLRANENIHDDSDSHLPSPIELFQAVDPPNCPTEPIYHDLRSTKHPVMADLIEKRRVWYEEDYLPHKHLGTFVSTKEELFVTLPKGSKFVFWSQDGGVDGVFTPVLKMSAWYEEKNHTVIAHTGQTTADTYTWNFIDPNKMDHNLNQKKITLEGDYVVWITGWFFQYQHLLIDHLGYLVYLSKVLPPTTRILMPRVGVFPLFYSMILRVDQTLADRIDFINCQDYVHCYNEMFVGE